MADERSGVNGIRTPSSGEVAEILSERIRTGVLKAGDRMPTQESLAEQFGVERGAIRQALTHLEEAGLLEGRTRGAPARIAELSSGAGPAAEEPQQTIAGLGPRIMEAFEAPHVRIDAICLTAETLNLALAEPLQLIRAGRVTPATVKVRLLLPARDLDLAFPRPAESSGDERRVHEHWLSLRNTQGAVLRHSLRALRSTRSIDVEVTLKALPFTPPVKLYLLNGSEALFAFYTVKRREEQIDDTSVEIYDALGSDSMLFPFGRGGEKRDEAFVTQAQAWFDGLWGTIATEITLAP
ncbi:GntR family transcriptional regulator [Streptomyces lunaelactis]|uniref:GntR family transcriptional regulator n=1 Tax=Streptomyces lunaelactis TaxID=1535768 RepID=UPI002815A7D6|nr:winged helix-turn-helix domain-containing protein [Streptomyces lunaelactis]